MAIKLYKPTTPGRRKTSVSTLPKAGKLPKRLVGGTTKRQGRASTGRITVRRRGAGAKRRIRTVDLAQTKEVPAVVAGVHYDPNRTARLALLKYVDGDQRLVLAEQKMKQGQKVETGPKAAFKVGNRMPLRRIPAGTAVFNLQQRPGGESTFVRAAGSAATVTGQEKGDTLVKLPSGEVRRIDGEALATVGQASNREHENVRIGKAGRKRHMGFRPKVRGKAMNPVDHPHGGGEGQQPIGLKGPKTPSGLYTLGRKTRKKSRAARRAKRIVREK
ncbi:MAG TPA: 50S ribosomal protein L2 [Patescibacteria group bacterium]|jgi:large subunit ribosomal protein L2